MPHELTDHLPPAIRQTDLPALPRQPGAGAKLLGYRPWDRPGAVRGHFGVDFSGWIVQHVPIFTRTDGSLSVGSPSAPEIDGEGRHRIGEDGKRLYWPLLRFRDRDARQRFVRSVLAALADAGVQP
jgi:hypothetical protein